MLLPCTYRTPLPVSFHRAPAPSPPRVRGSSPMISTTETLCDRFNPRKLPLKVSARQQGGNKEKDITIRR